MIRNIPAITANTFAETIRQPVYGIIIAGTILLYVFSPSLTMFTLEDDNLLLKDICISTLLVSGLMLAVFSTGSVISDEIDNKTVLTVISKTVGRGSFIVGKYLGVALAVLLAQFLLSLVLMITVRHGVLQTASDEPDWVVINLAAIVTGVTIIGALAGNYFYRWRFSSAAVLIGSGLGAILLLILSVVTPSWTLNPLETNMPWDLSGPIALVMLAVLILTAISVVSALSVNLTTSLVIVSLFFLLGVMAPDWLAGPAASKGALSIPAWMALAVIPNLNLFTATNAIYESRGVPASYIGITALYTVCYISAAILVAFSLFRRRELG